MKNNKKNDANFTDLRLKAEQKLDSIILKTDSTPVETAEDIKTDA